MHEVRVIRDIGIRNRQEKARRVRRRLRDPPFVTRSHVTGNKPTGLGSKRVCVFDDGSQIAEEITEYRPEV